MSKLVYYPQSYQCPNEGCKKITPHYVWTNEIDTATHTCTCGTELTAEHIYDKPISDAPAIKTPTMNRVMQASRKKRNLDHFKKKVYPTLKRGSTEQRHHAKKHGLK